MTEQTPFIDRDEYILLMDWPAGLLSVDDLKRLREAGVRTAYSYAYWNMIEPKRGVYRWAMPEAAIARAAQADMKLALMVTEHATWGPDEWYARQPDGRIWRAFYDGYHDGWPYSVLSPWNDEAMAALQEFQRMACERFNSPTVQCVYGPPHGGEVILPGMVECWFDGAAVASFRAYAQQGFAGDLGKYNRDNNAAFHGWGEVFPGTFPGRAAMSLYPTTTAWLRDSLVKRTMETQAIFSATPWREAWYMLPQREGEFAEAFESGPRSCNWLARDLYAATGTALGATPNILLYEVFRPHGTQNILAAVAGYEGQTWVGSQYVEGLKRNTQTAIDLGLRGFLTGPVHPDSGNRELTPEMVETFRWSIGQWKAARG